MKLMVKKRPVLYAFPETVFLSAPVKEGLNRDSELVGIQVVDKINENVFRSSAIKGRDQEQDALHSFGLFFSFRFSHLMIPAQSRPGRNASRVYPFLGDSISALPSFPARQQLAT